MALDVEDGTGQSDSESYISVADADTYVAKYYTSADSVTWDAADDPTKEVAARQATKYLDGKHRWKGTQEISDQALDWPRVGVFNDFGTEYDGLPPQLVDATAELMFLVVGGTTINVDVTRGKRLKRAKVEGAVEVEYEPGAAQQPSYPVVNRLVADLVWSSGQLVRS